MKAVLRSIVLGAIALAFMGSEASAQFAFMPLDYSIAPTGVGVTVNYGRGLNDESGKQNSVSGAVTFGGTSFFAGAGVGYAGAFGDNKAEQINFGGRVGFILPIAAETPITVAPVAGVNYWSNGDADVKTLTVPAGVTLAFTPPSSGSMSIQPFVTPYFAWTRVSIGGVSGTDTGFGGAGGVVLDFGMLGVIVIGDYNFDSKAFTAGGGVQVGFPTGS